MTAAPPRICSIEPTELYAEALRWQTQQAVKDEDVSATQRRQKNILGERISKYGDVETGKNIWFRETENRPVLRRHNKSERNGTGKTGEQQIRSAALLKLQVCSLTLSPRMPESDLGFAWEDNWEWNGKCDTNKGPYCESLVKRYPWSLVVAWHNCSDLTFLVPSEGLYVGRDSILHAIPLLVLELWRCEIGIRIGKEETHFSPPLCHGLSRHWDVCGLTCRRLNQQSPLLERRGGKQNWAKGEAEQPCKANRTPAHSLCIVTFTAWKEQNAPRDQVVKDTPCLGNISISGPYIMWR